MISTSTGIIEKFNEYAGANYMLAGLAEFSWPDQETEQLMENALLPYLLVSEAIARAESPHEIIPWLQQFLQPVRALGLFPGTQPIPWLGSLPACLPVILFTSPQDHQIAWQAFCQAFPSSSIEQDALRQVICQLLSSWGRNLFKPEGFENTEKYSSPEAAAIIKLGLTLNSMDKDTQYATCLNLWKDLLRKDVLHHLPERVLSDFAPEYPGFESLVFALLHTAEWLRFSEAYHIQDWVQDNQSRPGERATPERLALACILYGYVRGYHKIANRVRDIGKRSALSEQAFCLAIKSFILNKNHMTPDVSLLFYKTPTGSLRAYSQPYVKIVELEQQINLTLHLGIEGVQSDSRPVQLRFVLSVDQDRFRFTFHTGC